jgi:large subunit ribosomal protein L23
MALFGKKKNTNIEKKAAAVSSPVVKNMDARESSDMPHDLSHVLKHARVTEKASMQQGSNVYTFDVATSASKRDIILAVHALYKVTPRKVAVVNVPTKTKRNMRSGREGLKRGGKKAYVYLKSGETITLA